ncbi:MAG TPA: adenylate/guanylate cyclase domain-containing protein [Actinomycetota bacterium]
MAPAEDTLQAGRDALARFAWDDAYEMLAEADRQHPLNGEGLALLADAAWYASQPDAVIEAFERASHVYVEEGDDAAAAMMAVRVAEQYGVRQAMPLAGAWIARAQELSAGDPDCPAHGYLAYFGGFMAHEMRNYEQAVAAFDVALVSAEKFGDRDLHARTLHDKGRTLCWQGKHAEGLALMDQVMADAVAGDLGPMAAGYVYCSMIDVCIHLEEYERATGWTEATTRLCERLSIPGFTGLCRLHRAELLLLHGSLSDAEEQSRRASDELPKSNFLFGLGLAFYRIGEVRRRVGDLVSAEEVYAKAREFGFGTEPGMSLLRLAQGKPDAAASGIRRALSEADQPLERLRLRAAEVEIALAIADVETVRDASTELDEIAGSFEATAVQAEAARVRGALLLAEGDAEGALRELGRAREGWREVGAPYELAGVRTLIGRAHAAVGESDAAVLELRTAYAAFEDLGATTAAESVGDLLAELSVSAEAPERVRRAFMFTDIVRSTDLIGVIGDEAWENLLSWHDQTLRSLFASHGGEVAHHTGDGFFAAFPDADSALTAAVAVQRALVEHRKEHGFALSVRIGVHASEATRRGRDYSGAEVHKAARVAAAAAAEEILATDETLAAATGTFRTSEPRSISAKGIPEPVAVATVAWRP